jgi:O-antigen ligase
MRHNEKSYLSFFCVFFFSTLLVINPKTYALVFLLAFCVLYFILKADLIESVFLTFLLSLPFENPIREWVFYNNPNILASYSYHFTYSPKIILGILLIALLILPKNRLYLKKCPRIKPSFYLLIFFIIASLGSLFFHNPSNMIFFGLLRLSLAISTYFIASSYFSERGKKKIFQYYFFSLAIFSVCFGLIQLIKQGPIGSFIELTPDFQSETGYLTTDGKPQYRVTSFISHPVYFGSLLSMLIPLVIGIVWKNKNKFHFIYPIFIIISFIVLIGVLSRSTWINIFLIIVCFIVYSQSHQLGFLKLKFKSPKQILLLLVPIFLLSIFSFFIFFQRIESVEEIFSVEGSATVRIDLIKKSFLMIRDQPLFGVGLNKFTDELIQDGTLIGRAAPVHNTFLIFASELGLPATIFFILFLWSILVPKIKLTAYSPTAFACWVAIITFVVSSQFHPLFDMDPSFDILMLILGYFSTCQPQKI